MEHAANKQQDKREGGKRLELMFSTSLTLRAARFELRGLVDDSVVVILPDLEAHNYPQLFFRNLSFRRLPSLIYIYFHFRRLYAETKTYKLTKHVLRS